ncbi:hypothetical protein EGJ28_12250 [Stutzerimonas xanthomarina]|uniref:Uncharacterized protein n=1 Tax=Stutzerimonas xanthomarina TaxID=271420 RepID=A0A427E4U0_9GAMM|nr:hypothetical protein EGJ28_12250 [Stutzerimonas xanthomarina]
MVRWISTAPSPIFRVSGSSVSPCWATYLFQSRLPGREKSRQERLPLHPALRFAPGSFPTPPFTF